MAKNPQKISHWMALCWLDDMPRDCHFIGVNRRSGLYFKSMTDTYLLIILGILLASGVGVNVFLFRQEQQSKKDFAQLSELLAQVIIKIDAATSQNKTLQDLTNQKLIQLTQAVSKELLDETVNTRKVIEALKTSLEESIKF